MLNWLLAPAAFAIVMTAMVINAIVGAPKTALVGCGLITAGLPVFFWSKMRKAAEVDDGSRATVTEIG